MLRDALLLMPAGALWGRRRLAQSGATAESYPQLDFAKEHLRSALAWVAGLTVLNERTNRSAPGPMWHCTRDDFRDGVLSRRRIECSVSTVAGFAIIFGLNIHKAEDRVGRWGFCGAKSYIVAGMQKRNFAGKLQR